MPYRARVRRSSNVIPPLKKGLMKAYGYHHIKNMTLEERKKSLKRAIRDRGYVDIIRHLSAVATLSKNSNPDFYQRVKKDQQLVSKWYQSYKLTGKKYQSSLISRRQVHRKKPMRR